MQASHLAVQEKDGLGMIEFAEAMKNDALSQDIVVSLLGAVLDKSVSRNAMPASIPLAHGILRSFESKRQCPLAPTAFFERMLHYSGCSPCCFLVGVIYLQRINIKCNSELVITPFNLQRLLLTAVMIASKYLDDLYSSNKHWASIGDLDTRELNKLELELLQMLDFSLGLTRECYNGSWDALVELANPSLGGTSAGPDLTSDRRGSCDVACDFRSAGTTSHDQPDTRKGHLCNSNRLSTTWQSPLQPPGPISPAKSPSSSSSSYSAHSDSSTDSDELDLEIERMISKYQNHQPFRGIVHHTKPVLDSWPRKEQAIERAYE